MTPAIARRLLGGAAVLALASAGVQPAAADTLQEALTEAYVHSPILLGARAQQRATDEIVPIAKADGRPNASLGVTYTEYILQSSDSPLSPDRTIGAGVDLGVPLYQGGGVKNSIKAAKERVEAGQADLRGTESTLFTQVVAAYMDVLRNEAVVGLTRRQVEVLNVNLEATSDRFEIGDLTRTDVAQSQARLALAQGDARNAEANLITARENYIALVGSSPDDLQPPPPLPGLPETAAQAVDVALDENPDLDAARQRSDASAFDIEVAGSQRLPRVSVFTGYNYNNNLNSAGTAAVPVTNTSDAAQAGVRLTLPLYQGGRPAAYERQAQEQSAAAQENVIATERDVIAQVRSAWSSWQAANEVITSTQTAVSAAELSLEGTRAENSIGNRTILEVLNAEQELLQAQVQLVTARRNAYVAGFSLLAAMGRAEARDLGFVDEGLLYDPQVNYDRVKGKWFDWEFQPDPTAQSTRTVDVTAPDSTIPPDAITR